MKEGLLLEYVWWTILILLFIGSLIGIIVPLIPEAVLLWCGFLLYQFLIGNHGLPQSFWWGAGLLTAFLLGSDFLANAFFVKKYGGSKWGVIASTIGILGGPIFLGPIGVLIGPFILVFIFEWVREQDVSLALKIALSSLGAFFGSVAVKFILQIAIIVWFFIVVKS